jgi:DNA-binding PucR family transcriptional regulator
VGARATTFAAADLASRTRHEVAAAILAHARSIAPDAQLWLLDRPSTRLARPDLGGRQTPDHVMLASDEPFDRWPDAFRLPAPAPTDAPAAGAPTPALAQLADRLGIAVTARTLRHGGAADVHGLLLAPPTKPSAERALTAAAADAAVVLSNHTLIESLRERAAQLSTLYDTAHVVSAELDLDRVLGTICTRARTLTGTDVAYIALVDPTRGYCEFRAHDGVRTDAFANLKLGLGQGLGGLVAKEGRPYYSSDYLHDGRFLHLWDTEVADEGIVSVMGVPLMVDGVVLGVLFAAYRRMTAFSEEDVAFLESLAEHASIAIANARLHKQTENTLARERRLHRIAEQRQAELERITRLQARLTELVLSERPINELLAEIGAALGGRVELHDSQPDLGDSCAVPVAAGSTTLGWLALAHAAGDADRYGLEQAARVVALHLLRDRAVTNAEYRIRAEFLDRVLAGQAGTPDEVLRRASYLGIDLAGPLAALFLLPSTETGGGNGVDHVDLVARAVHDPSPGALVAGRDGGVVVVGSGKPDGLASAVLARLGGGVTIGATTAPTTLAELPAALADARRAARAGRAAGRTGVITRDDLGVFGVLYEQGADVVAFAAALLEPLVDYDVRHGSNLVATLRVYLATGCNAAETARRLPLHVNSLYYRLNRIRDVGGYDLDDPERRFELELAVRIWQAQSG